MAASNLDWGAEANEEEKEVTAKVSLNSLSSDGTSHTEKYQNGLIPYMYCVVLPLSEPVICAISSDPPVVFWKHHF